MIYVIYHAGCPDGFGAAWATYRHFAGLQPRENHQLPSPSAYSDQEFPATVSRTAKSSSWTCPTRLDTITGRPHPPPRQASCSWTTTRPPRDELQGKACPAATSTLTIPAAQIAWNILVPSGVLYTAPHHLHRGQGPLELAATGLQDRSQQPWTPTHMDFDTWDSLDNPAPWPRRGPAILPVYPDSKWRKLASHAETGPTSLGRSGHPPSTVPDPPV